MRCPQPVRDASFPDHWCGSHCGGAASWGCHSMGSEQAVPPGKLKMLYEVVQEYPVLTDELIALYRWALRYYACSPEALLEAMIPAAIRRGMKPKTQRT